MKAAVDNTNQFYEEMTRVIINILHQGGILIWGGNMVSLHGCL